MNKIFATFCWTLLIILQGCKSTPGRGDTSQNALDWEGAYQGILPCADCEGIMTSLTLRKDQTFTLQSRYLGKDDKVFQQQGRFEWNKAGNQVTLKYEAGGSGPAYYLVGENKLVQLDQQGQQVRGALAAQYTLWKNGNGLNRYWKLFELNGNPLQADTKWNREPHMILHTRDARVSGSGGCNTFSGSFQLADNNRISFSPLAATKMFCNEVQQTEELMFRALQHTDSYYLSGDTLQLIRARMAPLAKFHAVYLR